VRDRNLLPLINRDLSDLAFVERVIEEAENSANPVLERARFLAISGMLLDEFYRIRVAVLREQIRSGSRERSREGLTPAKQLKRADKFSNRLTARQDRSWRSLRRELSRAGIELVTRAGVKRRDREWLRRLFDSAIRPRLAPSSTVADGLASIRDGELILYAELALAAEPHPVEVVVPIPTDLPRFVALPGEAHRFLPIEEIIKCFLDELFDAGTIAGSGLARILREGRLRRDDRGADLLSLVQDAIERRERAEVVRLRVERAMPEPLLRKLAARLGLLQPEELKALEKSRRRATASEFVVADAFLGLADLEQLIALLPPATAARLRFLQPRPKPPAFIAEFGGDLFAAIAAKDRLLHFPYDDFDALVSLIEQAAADPAVRAIRQTLYRTGRYSPIVESLAQAAKRGKAVAVVVEVEAREDERRNIEVAAYLEAAGVDVSYGLLERKVHAKLLVIERLEGGLRRRFAHCSTGNYSVSSGHSYTDLSLFSADEALASDLDRLFAYVHGGVLPGAFADISAAPFGLRDRINGLIETEIRHAEAGRPAAIWMKLNRLSDEDVIRSLYRASQAGVAIEIIVRGICCLRPGVAGISERIRVKSVVGRYLEHSRAFCFGNGAGLPSAAAAVFISSADLMAHKLDERVEVIVPIGDADLRDFIQHEVFLPYLQDQANSWRLGSDDDWERLATDGFCVQHELTARSHAPVERRQTS
jgi:polyphosphate kinase